MTGPRPRICIYTVIFGNYDQLHHQAQQSVPCDYLCFTNNPNLKSDIFRIILDDPLPRSGLIERYDISPVNYNIIGCILYRTNLFLIPQLREYDICLYIDGNVQIMSPNLVSDLLGLVNDNFTLDVNKMKLSPDIDLIISKHPAYDCIYSEGQICMNIGKYFNTDLGRQLKEYRDDNHPANGGLYWNGFIVYLRPFDPKMVPFYQMYTDHMVKYVKNKKAYYHPQGQVSLPYVLSKVELKIHVHPPLFRSDPRVGIHDHHR